MCENTPHPSDSDSVVARAVVGRAAPPPKEYRYLSQTRLREHKTGLSTTQHQRTELDHHMISAASVLHKGPCMKRMALNSFHRHIVVIVVRKEFSRHAREDGGSTVLGELRENIMMMCFGKTHDGLSPQIGKIDQLCTRPRSTSDETSSENDGELDSINRPPWSTPARLFEIVRNQDCC
jgi:hypothetical protein